MRLRGHHLLCLLGYRGMGYSKEYVENMTQVHKALRSNPEARVSLVAGPDDLCAKFPSDKPYHCHDSSVTSRDDGVLRRLGFEVAQTLTWSEIEHRISERVVPGDVRQLCTTCPWLPYGVCEEGVERIVAGLGMPEVK